MLLPNDLSEDQRILSDEVIRLCVKEHGSHPVVGWEVSLWRASLGQIRIESLSYPEMTHLLSLAQKAGGWVFWTSEGHTFYPVKDWLNLLKSIGA